MITRRTAIFGAAVAAVLTACPALADDLNLPREKATLVAPPFVMAHEQATTSGPKIVEFTLTVVEKPMVIDEDGTTIPALTFNGSIPGPLMVVHEGDYVEVTLVNPATNTMMHDIDFHAATGGLGGAEFTSGQSRRAGDLPLQGDPRRRLRLSLRAGRSDDAHSCRLGMNGAIMVLPRGGLKDGAGRPLRYDRIYYIGEQDFYVPRDEKGNFKSYKTMGDSMPETLDVMQKLIPTHVVFEGRVGALTGKNALKAKVGERVLIIHSQANRDTRPHLIGGHGDYVWETGKFDNPPQVDQETWFIRGGSAGAALYTFRQPGLYAYVNHNLIEAALLGATAHFKVEGKWNNDLMMQIKAPGPIPNVPTY